jgi:CO/xanthine dehydrogenase FAD-binding subunit
MIIEYHRPATITQALELLSRPDLKTLPLGGGSVLSRRKGEDFAVVDLQALGLDTLQVQDGQISLGATVRLQALIDHADVPVWLKNACLRETGRNLREMSTIAGFLLCANGRSPLATVLLAADVQAVVLPSGERVSFQTLLTSRDALQQPWLITAVLLDTQVQVAFEFIARTPQDLPVLGIAVAKWPSGKIRVTVGGFGAAPALAYEGKDARETLNAVESVLQNSNDEWASAEYRHSVAPAVLTRLME